MTFLRRWHERLNKRVRAFGARNAAEGTYEAIRAAVIVAQPRSAREAGLDVVQALANRRAWRRLSDEEFECSASGRSSRITIPEPFDTNEFFQRVTKAEIDAFLGDSERGMLEELHEIGQAELRRLLECDSKRP